ncbi:MAG: hypothetical protein IPH06_00575 [Alphaproteobacteria bacterium]|jgi:hypothetical protein|nr:hypothetical protein [Alphaproteobacteria bacterium]QQS56568.1 MAG: hypothetical protein IPN28_09825 [Alphaproteobacteria bacterium]
MYFPAPKNKNVVVCFFLLPLLLLLTLTLRTQAFAEDEKTLEQILSPKDSKSGKPNSEKSGVELAYDFFEKCSTSPDYFVSEKIQKEYCRCKAAKMANSLSKKDFLALEEDSEDGNNARNGMRMNADSLCMRPAIKSYAKGVCMKDPHFKTIVLGKSKMCDCVADYMSSYAKKHLPSIIIRAATEYPLSLDPLSFFLSSEDFNMMYSVHKEYCYNKVVYSPK